MNFSTETDRFILRKIEKTDVDGLFLMESTPEVHRYLGEMPLQNKAQTEKIIDHIQRQYEANGIGRWAVIDKKTGDFVGWSGLKYEQEVRPDRPYYDLGYRFRKEYWGQGIATETSIASLKYGFEVLDLKKICAAAHIENIASNKVLQKVGMKLIETFDAFGDPHHWYELDSSF
jgi:ribosomal-protein-alanine N-acetyltransferase